MKRFSAFDPPEYADWKPDPAFVEAFRSTVANDPERAAIVSTLTPDSKLQLYRGLLRARLHDIELKRWVRTGVISKAWLGTGEEATTVGPVHALERGTDIVAPMIRNAAACCEMGMPIADMLRAYLATADSPSGGRDLHVGSFRHGILQPISHVGDMVPVITGIALTFKLKREPRVALTWVGDGSANTATAHEGTNFAAVQRVPAIFIIENNQVALGTRLEQHHLPPDFRDWPASYGVWGAGFDGNNVLDAYAATRIAAERCRNGNGPAILIAETFRMGGHATHGRAVSHVGQARPDRPVRGVLEGRGREGEAARRSGSRGDYGSGASCRGGDREPGEDAEGRERAEWSVCERQVVSSR